MAETNPLRVVVQLSAGGLVDQVAVASPIASRPEWLVALLFQVGGGNTNLVSHAVMPRPTDWPTEDDVAVPSQSTPHPGTLPARKWLARWANAVPTGGPDAVRLSTVIVRSALTSDLERWARSYVAALEGSLVADGAAGDPIRRPRGPAGGGDLKYALLARRYVELCHDGYTTAPYEALTAEFGWGKETVRSYLYRARERGLLTSPGRGRTGGALTPRALALIEEN